MDLTAVGAAGQQVWTARSVRGGGLLDTDLDHAHARLALGLDGELMLHGCLNVPQQAGLPLSHPQHLLRREASVIPQLFTGDQVVHCEMRLPKRCPLGLARALKAETAASPTLAPTHASDRGAAPAGQVEGQGRGPQAVPLSGRHWNCQGGRMNPQNWRVVVAGCEPEVRVDRREAGRNETTGQSSGCPGVHPFPGAPEPDVCCCLRSPSCFQELGF